MGQSFEKNGGCLFNLWMNVRAVFFNFVYLSLICILRFCFAPLFLWEEGIFGFFHNLLMLILVLLLIY